MARFYRVLKETPLWEEGAIISNDSDSGGYRPVDELFVKEIDGVNLRWYEGAAAVEKQPEWFERVYKVSVLKKVQYLAKDAAKKVMKDQYKG